MPTNPTVVNHVASVIVPSLLAGAVGYATYVFVKLLCIDYLLNGAYSASPRPGIAIALLVIYFLLLLFMLAAYGRLLHIILTDPGFLPLGPAAKGDKRKRPQSKHSRHSKKEQEKETIGRPYTATSETSVERDDNADSPGLELFYTKRVFVCSQDGRPKWCSECANWKPDRTHHCSDIGRCVYKMDHYCPWVGGVVGENNFKFFIIFVTSACIFCIFLLIVTSIYLAEQLASNSGWQRQLIALLALSTFFSLFTGGMSGSSLQFALYNLTTIENLAYKRKPWTLAVLIPPDFETPKEYYPTITYPLPTSENLGERTEEMERSEDTVERETTRDTRAKRTFAIMQLGIGRNPWDLGYAANFRSVMGNKPLDWFLPINRSPLRNHESEESWFEYGHWVEQMLVDVGYMRAEEMRKAKPVSRPWEEKHPFKARLWLEEEKKKGRHVMRPVGMPTDGLPERVKRMYSGGPRVDGVMEERPVVMTAEGIPRRAKVGGDT